MKLIEKNESFNANNDMKYVEQLKELHCEVSCFPHQANSNDREAIPTSCTADNSDYYQIGTTKYIATEGMFDSSNTCHRSSQYILSTQHILFFLLYRFSRYHIRID
jgi:hypothetical protein